MFKKVNKSTKTIILAMLLGAWLYSSLMSLYQDYVGQEGWIHMVQTEWTDSRILTSLSGLSVVFIVWTAWGLIRFANK